jgi:hypothetical protein
MEVVRAFPEPRSAYVGTAQVSSEFGDPRMPDTVIDAARRRGDADPSPRVARAPAGWPHSSGPTGSSPA